MRPIVLALTAASLVAAATVAQAGPTYRWVDSDGVVHYGDRVPPEYAEQRSDVLNRHGVAVGARDGLLSEAERQAEQREAEAQEARVAQQRRDRVLLDTYISVDEIRMLRDRRLEMLQAQLDVTAGTLERLYQQLHELEMLAEEYQPYSNNADAPGIPDDLANDLASTHASVLSYERTLENSRDEQMRLMRRFEEDISRFEELQSQRRSRLR